MRLSDWVARVDLTEEIQEVYLHRFLYQLGKKLVAIFIPLYLLQAGFTELQVIVFYLISLGIPLLSSIPAARLASRIGYTRTSLTAAPFIMLYYYLLNQLTAAGPHAYLLAALGGISFNTYWIGMNPEVATASLDEKRTEESGFFYSMSSVAAAISPFLGGLIIAQFSFHVLFTVAVGFVMVSFLPYIFTAEHTGGMDADIVGFLRNDFAMADFRTFFVTGALFLGKMLVWPFYLATVLTGTVGIGGAGTVLAIASAVTSAVIGKLADRFGKLRIVAAGATITAITYLGMSQVTTPLQAVVVSGLNGLSFTVFTVPIFSTAMTHSEQEDVLEYFAVRELALTLGRITALMVFAAAFLMLPQHSFLVSFSILALFALILPLVDRQMLQAS